MTAKSTPISVRITPRDAEFISELDIDEAITPSDKIRALLKEARKKRDAYKDLSTCFGLARKAVDPVFASIREEEISQQMHSELISCFGEWLTDVMGYIASLEGEDKHDLITIEKMVCDRIFRLCNMMIRMGVTEKAPCYDPEIIAKNLSPLMEISNIIQERNSKGGKS